MKKFFKFVLFLVLFLVVVLIFILWKLDYAKVEAVPLTMSTENADLSAVIDPVFVPKFLLPTGEPQHPFMAPTDQSVMHSGGWESDVHPASAVFTDTPKITTRRVGGLAARQCATFTFTSKGYPLTLCDGLTSFQLQLLDPNGLSRLAKFDLPMRPSTYESFVKKDPEIIFSDTSSAYVYLDHQDRILVGDSHQHIRQIGPVEKNGKWSFEEFENWDMNPYVPNDCFRFRNHNPSGECDALTTIMPDYNGLIWWTCPGLVPGP